jgi:drug/metabolite transporter (DMT)-like permease
MIASGIAWALHDRYRVSWSILIPAMLILLGVLMLVARNPRIPVKRGEPASTNRR